MKKAKKIISLIITASMAFTILPIQIKNALADDKDKIINFKDEKFKDSIIDKVDKNGDGEISIGEMQELTYLSTTYVSEVTDISEIKYAINLKKLDIYGGKNNISDISVLSNLKSLEELDLSENNISDISILSGLTNLKKLTLSGNEIIDINALSNLTNLEELSLDENKISDISVLKSLTNLKELNLSSNNINDISVLGNLTNLIVNGNVYFSGNNISNSNEELVDILANKEFVLKKGTSYYNFAKNINTIFSEYHYDSSATIKMKNHNENILKMNFSTFEIGGVSEIYYYYYSFLAKDIGEATIDMELGNIKKSFKIKVEGINENQPLGDKVSLSSEIFSDIGVKNYIAYIKDKGQVWDISEESPKLMVNKAKKYVASYIYNVKGIKKYVGEKAYKAYEYGKTVNNLALDSNDTLWSWGASDEGDKYEKSKEMSNVKDFDERYALNKNNELWQYFGEKSMALKDVKDWVTVLNQYGLEIDNRLIVLKNDNSVWGRVDSDISKRVTETGDFYKISDNAIKLVSYFDYLKEYRYITQFPETVGFINNKDEYYIISSDLKIEKIADNVKNIIEGFIVKKDNTTWSRDGKKKLVNSEISNVIEEKYSYGKVHYLISSTGSIFRYDYKTGNITTISELPNEYNSNEHTLKFNGIDLLTSVNKEYNFRYEYYYNEAPYEYLAVRSDGSIRAYGNDIIPTMIIDGKNIPLNGDLDGNDKVNSFDALKILKISSKGNITEEEKKLADINKDGKVNSLDALKVLQYETGKIDKLE